VQPRSDHRYSSRDFKGGNIPRLQFIHNWQHELVEIDILQANTSEFLTRLGLLSCCRVLPMPSSLGEMVCVMEKIGGLRMA